METVIGRLGKNSKMVICGDMAQIDLRDKRDTGFSFLSRLEEQVEGFKVHQLERNHRHEIVTPILEVYKTISQVYKVKKVKSIYININPTTYFYRKNILDKINEKGILKVSTNKPYREYLQELAEHRFCLCIRGNGIDTHRFWESLYLGVIPVIINNNDTDNLKLTNAHLVPVLVNAIKELSETNKDLKSRIEALESN